MGGFLVFRVGKSRKGRGFEKVYFPGLEMYRIQCLGKRK